MSFLKGFNGGFNSSFINTSTNVVPSGFTWKPATFTWGFGSGNTPSFNVTTSDGLRAITLDNKTITTM